MNERPPTCHCHRASRRQPLEGPLRPRSLPLCFVPARGQSLSGLPLLSHLLAFPRHRCLHLLPATPVWFGPPAGSSVWVSGSSPPPVPRSLRTLVGGCVTALPSTERSGRKEGCGCACLVGECLLLLQLNYVCPLLIKSGPLWDKSASKVLAKIGLLCTERLWK